MLDQINIYTDGSAIGNPGPGGYGIVMEWKVKEYIKHCKKLVRIPNQKCKLHLNSSLNHSY